MVNASRRSSCSAKRSPHPPAWQSILACDALRRGQFDAANVSVVGTNQQAIGARFVRTE